MFGNIVLTLCTGWVIHLSSFTLFSSSRATLFLAPAFCRNIPCCSLLPSPSLCTAPGYFASALLLLRLQIMSAQPSQW